MTATPAATRPLVSVVMPAYKATWLPQALESVLRQTHRPLELVVCDDSRDGRVQAAVEAFAARVDFPVHYSRNPERLWETRSTARGVALAGGEFIKFLHDDDVLHNDCIATLLEAFERVPGLGLAAARRRLVDERGRTVADELPTAFPAHEDILVDGADLVDFLADHTLNFIGEPSAALCRRAPLLALGDGLSELAGVRVPWVADLALYVKLLRQGPLAMTCRPLVDFRISRTQFSQHGRDRPGIGESGHAALRDGIRTLGWYRGGDTRQVSIGPLDGSRPATRVDLREALGQALAWSQRQHPLREWGLQRRRNMAQYRRLLAHMAAHAQPPRLGVLVRAQGQPMSATRRTLASLPVAPELLRRIRVRGIGDGLSAVELPSPFPALEHRDGDHAASLDAALADWDVDWVLVVEAGDEFAAGGITRLLLTLDAAAGDLRALSTDSWQRDAEGGLVPVLRPALNLDLLLGNPSAMCGPWIFRRTAIAGAGGFDPGPAGAQALDLVLRLLEHGGLGGIDHLAEPLLLAAAPPVDTQAQQATITRHLHARGYPDARVSSAGPGLHRIDYGHGRQPPVSLVVVADGDLALLQRCVLSVLEKTDYPDYELLVVDNGLDPAGQHWLDQAAGLARGRLRVFALDGPVAHAAACNLAAGQARGEFLLFLRAQAAVIQPQWLAALLNHGLRPEVGVTGARTVSADGRITHAGLVPALVEGDGRAFLDEPMDAPGHLGRLQVAHDCQAVADDCLLVARALFEQLGGFDAGAFPHGGADVDLCLRVAQAGGLTVCTPDALLLHAPAPRPPQVAAQVRDALCERWLPQLAHDPAYNPSLRLDVAGGFRLGESDFSWRPLPDGMLPRVLAQPADPWGSGQYRVIQPFEALKAHGLAEGALNARLLDPVELARIDPDVVVMQRRIGADSLAKIERMQRFCRALRIYELDDWLPGLPAKSAHRAGLPADLEPSLRAILARVDRLVVATPALAEAFAGWHPDIRVAPNRLDPGQWTALPRPPERPPGTRPRVGWAGGRGHLGDLEMVAGVVRALAGEVDWVFMGLCPDRLRPFATEVHEGLPFHAYSRALAQLDLDLAIAPLEDNRFNHCKSALRLLEYGACAFPVVCSDLEPYRIDLPVTRVRNREADWIAAIRLHLAEREATAAAGQALKQAIHRDWLLRADTLEPWRRAWLPD